MKTVLNQDDVLALIEKAMTLPEFRKQYLAPQHCDVFIEAETDGGGAWVGVAVKSYNEPRED